jgi:hypothetical protein
MSTIVFKKRDAASPLFYLFFINSHMLAFVKKIFTLGKPNPQVIHPSWTAAVAFKEKLTLDDAKFIFEQAEKLLNDSVGTSETIVSRMNTLITLITGSMLALIGYIISRIGKDFVFDPPMFTASVGALFLYVLAFHSFQNNQPKDYLLPGSVPKDLFNPAFFDKAIPNDQRIVLYYVNELENYMYRIEINNEINEKRWKRYSMITGALLWLPIILIICYLFTKLWDAA